MATQLQLRKGTKVQNDAFTGAEAELTYDSTSKGLRLHDGTQQGGYEVPVLVAVQRPTAENNYTWFRVWSDGWVEQGGNTTGNASITLPVTMADLNYNLLITPIIDGTNVSIHAVKSSTSQINIGASSNVPQSWMVCGLAAQRRL